MTMFRSSKFIDFDAGSVHMPPMELQRLLPPRDQQSPDQMFSLFERRVDVWTFGPAVEMLKAMDVAHDQKSVWAHAGYGLLDVTCKEVTQQQAKRDAKLHRRVNRRLLVRAH